MLHNIYFCFFMQKICVNTFLIVNVLLQFVYFAFQTVAHYQEQAPVHQIIQRNPDFDAWMPELQKRH